MSLECETGLRQLDSRDLRGLIKVRQKQVGWNWQNPIIDHGDEKMIC